MPDYYERTTSDWIIFPWERKEALRKVIEKFQENGKSVGDAMQTLIKYGVDPELIERLVKEISEDTK